MDLKINRYLCENITNRDWILDNNACYQVMTRTHYSTFHLISRQEIIIMSKKQFKQLLKEGKLIRFIELENSEKFKTHYGGCKAWRFNVD